MALDLKNQHILITGSTDGLGKILALELAKKEANIIIHGKDQDTIDKIIQELERAYPEAQFASITCDLSQPNEIAPAFSKLNRIDILINNAGIWLEGNSVDAPIEKIIEIVNVDLTAPLLVTRTLLPKLLESDFSQILNVVSIAGVEIPQGFYHTFYSAVKYGLQGFNEAIAKEFDNKNLRMMGYYPGGMETAFFKKAGNNYQDHEPWMFDPIESAEAILFMLTRNKKVNIKRLDLINHLQE